ncbi:hypothetical protein SBF1_1290004 [Candidatus Desulfosporosinus infrequens]|uniref:Uncharacterized protein n=1 Tax=Candidatus Desulfosporosinus infrequens TaxID=2043169 RepID=A0A2U3K3I1_9FIRM|nr:hypothetical protein SBF1_1290004 [Candidatus Desulfosporosinus infrequens]
MLIPRCIVHKENILFSENIATTNLTIETKCGKVYGIYRRTRLKKCVL